MIAIHQDYYNPTQAGLYMALELSQDRWRLGFTTGAAQKPREREVAARDVTALMEEIKQAKARFGLPHEAKVVSCYEAGRDGFWLHRYLLSVGVDNRVVDSSSIQVERRKRRAKTDHLDVQKLLKLLIREQQGEPKVWSVVHVPSEQAENDRQLHRELEALRHEQTRHINRVKGLLASYGVAMAVDRRFPQRLQTARMWDSKPLPEDLCSRLLREFSRMQQVNSQVRELEQVRARRIREGDNDPTILQMRKLMRLRGIAVNSSWLFCREVFGWRKIRNRRQLAAVTGLVPVPYASGRESRDQGISKAGNRRMRAILIEIGWDWLRLQPQSTLSGWFDRRFGHGSKRLRRIGIVAVARKLIVALQKYLETGTPPEGATLVDWESKLRRYTLSLSSTDPQDSIPEEV